MDQKTDLKTHTDSPWLARLSGRLAMMERSLCALGEFGQRKRWVTWFVWLGVVLVTVALIFRTGCAPIWCGLNDSIALLDGAWRMHHGQMAHRDFYSVLGPLPLSALRVAFEFFGPSPDSLAKGTALFGVAYAGVTLALAIPRMSPVWSLLLAFAVLGIATAPVPLGIGEGGLFGFRHQTTYAMFYNRLGWAALVPALIGAMLPRRTQARPRLGMGESALVGLSLLSAAVVKLNFMVAAFMVFLWLAWFNLRHRAFWIGLGAGLMGSLVLLQVVGANPGGYLADQWTLLQVSRHESYLDNLLNRVGANIFFLAVLESILIWIWFNRRSSAASSAADRGFQDSMLLAGWTTMVISLIVTTFNFERWELPGLLVVGVMIVEAAVRPMRQHGQPGPDSGDTVRAGVAKFATLLLFVSYMTFDYGAMVYSAIWKQRHAGSARYCEQLQGENLHSLPVPIRWDETSDQDAVAQSILARPDVERPAVMMTSLQFSRWINDGADLLKAHLRSSDRVFVADWFNPFNLCLGLKPATGGALLWDYLRMMDQRHHPDVDRTMSEVTLIMVPKKPHIPGQSKFMIETFVKGTQAKENQIGESTLWTLYEAPLRKSKN